ncbi:MAG TPA: KR domain-containing protein [Nitrosomonas nitrosa]|mgnify:CR=1 FL=1|jgi:NAD(P)-dependent dehydrogenase (short-subunit alcohol dehydrogenase family)|uniref:NAD(P)-dependent dehydrogenase, short-chain alcohol dehydrogenase family n=1 Tax=Nitrosomonas nitrosa TaxID=52442 RepID=A0A1I4RHZ7_9PROT|nr:SDR family oxidoreductase [Nitrosomonas nitrosa]MCO6433603.1 SDR family oxidoreductase [Nitrosomonas nitrosa]PTQ94479.1 NAD(P)-dependent dehydrogenase (short-subunit alcohol dehydrogenase family) [Nitrosomonas nitrosa]CAE6498801.1 NAD(P)-dependent dehydrogenase, short-chain alcohol dehydrogenase family [Nitrosomonas nitrosa]SFM51888.1 NAD(P)-dependent dehydrogenase, short-chain alcohol dehydrogenase family [Nitrosomonas nitrosa]HBZ30646.1 KR domain-containing protein [Nitrosomonas nitrosa]
MPTILITGSNRGLGLEWCRQYVQAGWRVLATCRFPAEAKALQQLKKENNALTLHRLDVTDHDQIHTLAKELADHPIDLLINNAGVYFEKYVRPDQTTDYGAWAHTFSVNSIGAMRVSRAFLDHLRRSQKRLIVAITSHMGSIAEIENPGSYFYRSSKAALNAAMKGFSLELKPLQIGVLLLHPGWVRTQMGGPDGLLSPQESVENMRNRVDTFTLADSGRFLRYDGHEIPW